VRKTTAQNPSDDIWINPWVTFEDLVERMAGAPPEVTIRHYCNQRELNGLTEQSIVLRKGKRLYIHAEKFINWWIEDAS